MAYRADKPLCVGTIFSWLSLVVIISAIDFLERFVPEMNDNVSSRTLNLHH